MTTELVPSTTEGLIELLDPNRDYGERSYEQVCEQVRKGELTIKPPVYNNMPVLRDPSANGRLVRGSGRSHVSEVERDIQTKGRFLARAQEDFDAVYESLVDSATRGDVRAQKVFMEMFVGRPKEMVEVITNDTVRDLFEGLSKKRRERHTVVEVVQQR